MQVQANGIAIEVDEHGPEDGEPILLIMGLGGQLTLWPIELVNNLAARGFRVIRFDNRDVGLSAKFDHVKQPNLLRLLVADFLGLKPKSPYLLDDMADDAVGVLDALGIGKAHIVGASMGGMIAQLIAAHHPDRVLSLTSIMSTSGHRSLSKPAKEVRSALLSMSPRKPKSREAILQQMLIMFGAIASPGYPMSDTEKRDLLSEQVDRSYSPGGLLRQIAAIVASGDRRELLKKITAPTVVLHGEADPLVPVDGGRDTALYIRGSEFITVPGMGHDLPPALVPTVADAIMRAVERARTNSSHLTEAAE